MTLMTLRTLKTLGDLEAGEGALVGNFGELVEGGVVIRNFFAKLADYLKFECLHQLLK